MDRTFLFRELKGCEVKMVRIGLLFIFSLVCTTVAAADSVLNVAITSTGPFLGGSETAVSLTFDWDPTTNVLSDFNLQTVGPLTFSGTPTGIFLDGDAISDITFLDSAGDALQFDYNENTSFNLQPIVGNDQPSLFDIACTPNPVCTDGQVGIIFFHGETVIAKTAEAQTAELLLLGFLTLIVVTYRRQ
jgi:hypothetical protein